MDIKVARSVLFVNLRVLVVLLFCLFSLVAVLSLATTRQLGTTLDNGGPPGLGNLGYPHAADARRAHWEHNRVRVAFTDVATEWIQRYNYCLNCQQPLDEAKAIGLDAAGNVYVGGYSTTTDNNVDWAVVKYSPNGSQIWVARYGGAAGGFDALYAMKVDP